MLQCSTQKQRGHSLQPDAAIEGPNIQGHITLMCCICPNRQEGLVPILEQKGKSYTYSLHVKVSSPLMLALYLKSVLLYVF